MAYEYPPYSFGGIGSFSKDLSLALSLAGIKLTVIAFSHHRTITIENVNTNLTVVRVPALNFPPRHLWWQACNRNLIVSLLSKLAPDLIHSNSLVASLPLQTVKKSLDIPQIMTIHGDNKKILEITLKNTKSLHPYDFLQYVCFEPLYEKLLQKEMETVDCAVAVSCHLKNDISDRFKTANIKSVYNGIDLGSFLANRNTSEVTDSEMVTGGSQKKNVRIAYVGRLYWIKGVTYALKAFAVLMRLPGLRNVELNIYGDGPLRTTVKKFAERSQSSACKVHYCGVLPRDQLLIELLNSDIVIFPSLYEACPMALFEALSLGKAVVVSNMPWSKEFIEHKVNGLRVDTLDPETFAESLFELIRDNELRERVSKNASHAIEKYSMSNTVSMYLNIYKNLAK